MENKNYKQYLEPSFISKFSNLQISTNMILEGFMLGLHSSPLKGFSAEFSQHKQYSVGDSVKFIDWKIYGKTEKYYIKQFEDETNLYANIFLDRSSSMNFKDKESTYSKLDYARQLSAAIAQLFIKQKDAVALGFYADRLKTYIPPKSTKQHLRTLLVSLTDNQVNESNITHTAFEDISRKLNKPGIAIIISDFLEDSEKLLNKIILLKKQKQDIIIFMIADQQEYDFNYSKDMLMIDSETKEKLEIHPQLLQKEYNALYKDLIKKYEEILTVKGIYFKFVTTATSFDVPLREILILRSLKGKY